MTMVEIRRSSRQRKHAKSIYDEAEEELRKASPPKSRKSKDEEDDDGDDSSQGDDNNNNDDDSVMSEGENKIQTKNQVSDDDSSDSSSDESEAVPKSSIKKGKKKSPVKIRVTVQRKGSSAKKTKKSPHKTGSPSKSLPKGRQLEALRKKTMESKENPENSLLAAVMNACTSKKKKNDYEEDDDDNTTVVATRYPESFLPTPYTTLLEPVVKDILALLASDTNLAHIRLLNFIFRSVGGSFDSLISDDTNVEEMDDAAWESLVTGIVDDMRRTPPDSVLLCACPKGPLHQHDPTKHSVPQEEYRLIFEHFWYLLGTLCISSSATRSGDHHASSFDIERVRDMALHAMELVVVGQPDLRSAATIAALQLALAVGDGVLEFETRLVNATRQLQAAKNARTSAKQKALQQTVEALTRCKADLEDVEMNTVFKGVFSRRYRDTDPYIRATCMSVLSRMTLQRPTVFLQDIYLKYFGWMSWDKIADVRVAALQGLLDIFHQAEEQEKLAKVRNSVHPLQKIEIKNLDRVIKKFLPHIGDCVIDVSVRVQEKAIALLLALMRNGFLDDEEDDKFWNQINLRALATDTSPLMRRDALYFVVEQLESFDVDDRPAHLAEHQKVQQILGIADWISHALSDGPIPMENLRLDLTDFVVQSLREMPEHAHLMTDWNALLHAIKQDTESDHNDNDSQQHRATVAKQRVLIHMLASAAEMEMMRDDKDNDELGIIDPDMVRVRSQLRSAPVVSVGPGKKKKKNDTSATMAGESLSIGLVKALPGLLEAFRGDLVLLKRLTTLPQLLVSTVVILPQRKKDVTSLINILGEIFLESIDGTTLQNTCLALKVLATGDHARNREAMLKIRDLAKAVRERLLHLYELDEKSSPDSPSTRGESVDSENQTLDKHHAISVCLQRLLVLSKRFYLGDLLAQESKKRQDESTTVDEQDPCAVLCSIIAKNSAKQLTIRVVPADAEESNESWNSVHPKVHFNVARSVMDGLNILLGAIAWKLQRAYALEQKASEGRKKDDESSDSDDDESKMEVDETLVTEIEEETKSILRMRTGVLKLLSLCYDQYVDFSNFDDGAFSQEHRAFAKYVQIQAGKVAGDLRSLLPKEWVESASPLLRACALQANDDDHLIGGSVRFFRELEDEYANASNRGKLLKEDMILPMSRGIVANWHFKANRREAGAVLSHIAASGEEASKAVSELARILKKMEPIRLLEAHMACLRQGYADWVDMEPPEPETDRPSEAEMDEFAAAEKEHAEVFKTLEHKAARLSSSLGVGKLSDKKLYPALVGFVKEGIRFAFSDGGGEDEELLLGGQLSFLLLLTKYLRFVKDKTSMASLRQFFLERRNELNAHPDFEEVRAEDVEAMQTFGHALGIGSPAKKTKKGKKSMSPKTYDSPSQMDSPSEKGTMEEVHDEDEEEDDDSEDKTSPTSASTRRASQVSSTQFLTQSMEESPMSSVTSKRSRSTLLATLHEDEDGSEDGSGEPFAKKAKHESPSMMSKEETTKDGIEEEESSSDSDAS